jgi:hypothetical protein
MAKQPSNRKAKTSAKSPEPKFRFLNYTLTKEDLDELRSLDLEAEFPRTLVDELVLEGYKFSLSHDARNATFVASITDRAPSSAFQNACLTGRGSTPATAWYSLAYRHFVLATDDWSFFGDGQDDTITDFG